MLAEQRRVKILETIRANQFASLPSLAEMLGVSESTVRRDVELLEQQGYAQRTHGGVIYVNQQFVSPTVTAARTGKQSSARPGTYDYGSLLEGVGATAISNRGRRGAQMSSAGFENLCSSSYSTMPFWGYIGEQTPHWKEKVAIAKFASEMIEDGDTIFLDGGSTTYAFAEQLVSRPLVLITNSLPVANLFAADTNSELILIGGSVCPRTGVVRGNQTDAMIDQLRTQRAFIGTAGVDTAGVYNNNIMLVETEKAIRRCANELILITDSSKFGHQSLALTLDFSQIDLIITDSNLSETWQNILTNKGVKFKLAEVKN